MDAGAGASALLQPARVSCGRRARGLKHRATAWRRAGFTLIEMMLVIALIAVFVSLFVINADSMLKQTATQAVESKFWEAVRVARSEAIVERHGRSLRFDEKALAFVVENEQSGAEQTFAIKRDDLPANAEIAVALRKRVDRTQWTLVAGELVDLREIPVVRFFPDGACTPFVVTIAVNDEDRLVEIDPWTGAELLPDEEK